MRRMAGKLGCGGGPLAFLFSPRSCPQPQMLQEQIRNQGQQRMPMQAPPRAALEVIEPEFFLELLVRLLTYPARLDQGGQLLQRRVWRQVGQVVLALPRGTVLAHQPHLIAGQMLMGLPVQTNRWPVGDPYANSGELRPQWSLGAAPPGDLTPERLCQHRL